MKKTLIALAIAGFSFNAAAVNLANDTGIDTYASEITLPAALPGANLNVGFQLGFSATVGQKRYVRIDLTNATFANAVAAADLTTTAVGVTGLQPVVSVGGAVDGNFVVIEISPVGANLTNDAALTLALAKVNALGGDATVKYRLYETGVDAAAGNNNTLASDSGKLFGIAPALVVTTTPMFSTIDVTQESKFFYPVVGDANAEIGSLTVTTKSGVLDKAGNPATVFNLVKSAKLVVAGDFSAGLKDADGVLLNTAAVMDGHGTASASQYVTNKVTAAQALFTYTPVAAPVTATESLVYFVDGKTPMNGQDLVATFTPTANAGYTIAAFAPAVLGHMNKNGSSATANFVLAPDTSYNNLVRISNTSGIEGKFFITMINDSGKSVNFPLSAVAGQPATLAPNASSKQMKVADIFAAAQAKDPTFIATGDKKMRLKVEGEVGSLSLQNYTISKDGNALNTMNAF